VVVVVDGSPWPTMKGLGGQAQICGLRVDFFDDLVISLLVEEVSRGLSRSTMRGLIPTVCCCQGREG
jgi:hypothetical protein